MPRLHLGDWVDSAVNFLQTHLSWLFDAITHVVNGMYNGINTVLDAPSPCCSPASSPSSPGGCAVCSPAS